MTRGCGVFGQGRSAHASGRLAQLVSGAKCHPQAFKQSNSHRQRRCIGTHALGNKDGWVSNQDLLEAPWSSPGWRGAWVSSQPEPVQASLVAGATLLGAALTYFTYTTWGPWTCANVPLMDTYMKYAPLIQPPLFAAAGIAHFITHEEFCRFYPHQGAWGFWYLPGDPSFHVYWTGVAEVLGGVGCALGALNLSFVPEWVLPASAFGLFLLTTVVSPSNVYMWTHNAAPLTPEQLDELPGGAIDWKVHVFRGALQVVLLATYLGLAFHNY